MKPRFSLGCALLGLLGGACQQTLVLDDSPPDSGPSGTGGTGTGGRTGGSGGGQSDASSDGRSCPPPISFTADVPQVIVALDRSSMTTETPFGPQDTEFSAAAADLSAEVSSYQASNGQGHNRVTIAFSYLDFPDAAPDCNANLGCCSSDVTPTASSQTFQAAAYACNVPNACISSNNRPIAGALSTAQGAFAETSGTQTGERFVLLVAGGPPGDDCSTPSDCQGAINEIGALKNMNVTTYVVGVGDQTNDGCLQELANAEGTSQQFYSAATMPNDLVDALGMITGNVAQAACHLTLATTPSSTSQLTVIYGGTTVAQTFGNNGNGWSFDDSSGTPRLTLHGTACQNFVQGGMGGLLIYSGCVPDHFGQNP